MLSCVDHLIRNCAKIFDRLEDWEYSSVREYIDPGTNALCNRELATRLLHLRPGRFLEDSYLALRRAGEGAQVS